MPKTTKSGKAKKSELPSTLKKSPPKAQRTYTKAYDSALEQYGDEERANRTAYAALKHTYEKVGDHWEKKSPGPSEPDGSNRESDTSGGVDTNATKDHLYDIAKRLDVTGRSKMTKNELIDAIQKANERETRQNR